MRKLLSASALVVMLAWPTGYAGAQEVTASCKDGTSFTGSSRRGACARHGGVMAFGAAPTAPAGAGAVPAVPAPASSSTPMAPASPVGAGLGPAAAYPAPARPRPMPAAAAVAGGSAGQVWVNRSTKVYHCPGTRYFGKTQSGVYMTEAAAAAEGDRPSRGKACS